VAVVCATAFEQVGVAKGFDLSVSSATGDSESGDLTGTFNLRAAVSGRKLDSRWTGDARAVVYRVLK
jgi:hypothetical protein